MRKTFSAMAKNVAMVLVMVGATFLIVKTWIDAQPLSEEQKWESSQRDFETRMERFTRTGLPRSE